MRQSLSTSGTIGGPPLTAPRDRRGAARAVTAAVLLSAVLVAAAIIDQAGVHSLTDHAGTMYAAYGKRPDPNLLYGLVYLVGVIGLLLWLPVGRAVRAGRRSTPVLAGVVITITAALAGLLLASTEYGTQIFPPVWGVLAALPPAAGIVAAVLLHRLPSDTAHRSAG